MPRAAQAAACPAPALCWSRPRAARPPPLGARPLSVTEAVQAAPAPALRGLIAPYHGYRQEGLPPARHRGLPSPHLTLIITLDDPLTVVGHPDPHAPAGCYLTLAGAHLAREFRDLAGCPPSEWLAEEFRFVQAGEADLAQQSEA